MAADVDAARVHSMATSAPATIENRTMPRTRGTSGERWIVNDPGLDQAARDAGFCVKDLDRPRHRMIGRAAHLDMKLDALAVSRAGGRIVIEEGALSGKQRP